MAILICKPSLSCKFQFGGGGCIAPDYLVDLLPNVVSHRWATDLLCVNLPAKISRDMGYRSDQYCHIARYQATLAFSRRRGQPARSYANGAAWRTVILTRIDRSRITPVGVRANGVPTQMGSDGSQPDFNRIVLFQPSHFNWILTRNSHGIQGILTGF